MAESGQHLVVDEYAPQNYPGAESENQILDGNDAEQDNLVSNEFDQQTFPLDGDQTFMDHESEHFDAPVPEQDNEFAAEQNFAGNESEHQLDDNEADQGLLENDIKEEFNGNDQSDIQEGAEELHQEGKEGLTKNEAAGTEDKKWPGWPGESVFRMLVPAKKVGSIIGRKGYHHMGIKFYIRSYTIPQCPTPICLLLHTFQLLQTKSRVLWSATASTSTPTTTASTSTPSTSTPTTTASTSTPSASTSTPSSSPIDEICEGFVVGHRLHLHTFQRRRQTLVQMVAWMEEKMKQMEEKVKQRRA